MSDDVQKKIQEIIKNVEEAKKLTVKVGLPSDVAARAVYEEGKTILEVGAQHEYGTDEVPQRSFLRNSFFVKREEVKKILKKQFNKIVEKGADPKTSMELAGVQLQSIVQEAFTTKGFGAWPELSQRTIEEKGSSQILIDTGTLRSSITYRVQ